jgi:hypothetical protein
MQDIRYKIHDARYWILDTQDTGELFLITSDQKLHPVECDTM